MHPFRQTFSSTCCGAKRWSTEVSPSMMVSFCSLSSRFEILAADAEMPDKTSAAENTAKLSVRLFRACARTKLEHLRSRADLTGQFPTSVLAVLLLLLCSSLLGGGLCSGLFRGGFLGHGSLLLLFASSLAESQIRIRSRNALQSVFRLQWANAFFDITYTGYALMWTNALWQHFSADIVAMSIRQATKSRARIHLFLHQIRR